MAVATTDHPLLEALGPIVDAFGISVLDPDEMVEADVPLMWDGRVVGGLRRPDLHGALARLLTSAEQELGVTRDHMTRTQKQQAVTLLNEWGAFTLRKSVEDVAEALNVSRFTIYNYLERAESD